VLSLLSNHKMRCFISIDISKEIQEQIIKIQNCLPEFVGKKIESENLHLTLKFLGEISEDKVEEVKKRLERIKCKEFEAEIDKLGIFDNRKSIKHPSKIVVWLHIKGVKELQSLIDKTLEDLFRVEKRFMSHLTIARVKKVKDKEKFLEELNKIKFDKMKFQVNNFTFKQSTLTTKGSIYKNLEKYNLKS